MQTLAGVDEVEVEDPKRVDGFAAQENGPLPPRWCYSQDGLRQRCAIAERVDNVSYVLRASCAES